MAVAGNAGIYKCLYAVAPNIDLSLCILLPLIVSYLKMPPVFRNGILGH